MSRIALITLIAVSSLSATFVHAAPYAGINLGGNFTTIHNHLTYPLESSSPTTANFQNSYNNFHGQVFAGYNFPLKCKFSMAIEANGDYNAGSTNYKINNWFLTSNAQIREKLNYGYGIFLLPKYQYANKINFFIGPGFAQEKFQVESGAATGGDIGVTGSYSKWLSGWGLKSGVEINLTCHANFLLTYQYMSFNSVSWSNVEPLSGESLSARYRPTVNSVMIGIAFK